LEHVGVPISALKAEKAQLGRAVEALKARGLIASAGIPVQ